MVAGVLLGHRPVDGDRVVDRGGDRADHAGQQHGQADRDQPAEERRAGLEAPVRRIHLGGRGRLDRGAVCGRGRPVALRVVAELLG